MSLLVADFLLPLLLKGFVWMTLCGLAVPAWRLFQWWRTWRLRNGSRRWHRHGRGNAGKGNPWRGTLASLTFLSGLSLLPTLWTWYLPERRAEPVVATGVAATPLIITAGNEAPRMEPPAAATTGGAPVITEKSASWLTGWNFGQGLLLLWAGGTAGLGLWLATGFLAARRWIRQAAPLTTDAAWQEPLESECRTMGMRRPPRLLVSDSVPGPCAAGAWWPVILLPENCQDWNEETRRIVLRHELAHLRAGDPRQAWIRSAALAIHWLNPLVWTAIARSRRAEELAADSAVLAGGVAPDRYAAALLEVAKSCQNRFSARSFATHPLLTAMAHPSTLEDRIRLILKESEALSAAASGSQSSSANRESLPAGKSAGPWRFASAGAAVSLLAAGFIGCSSVEEKGSSGMLRGTPPAVTEVTMSGMKNLTTAKPAIFTKFKLSYRIVDAKGQLAAENFLSQDLGKNAEAVTFSGELILKKGQPTKIEAIREFPYPTEFDPPQWEQKGVAGAKAKPLEGIFPVIPTTPQKFEFRNMGWTLSELDVRPQGASLLVSGIFRETAFEGFVRNVGEAFSPIVSDDRKVVFTDNKVLSPTFTDRDTRFITAALPGNTYRTLLNVRRPDTYLELKCEPVNE